MGRGYCHRHGRDHPCTCAMGNVYRFVEPIVLLLLKTKGHSYGYDLAGEVKEHALTDGEIDRGALYRTLRQLEQNDYVVSEWDLRESGPARRVYSLTRSGEQHLAEWTEVLSNLSLSMDRFVQKARSVNKSRKRIAK